MAGCRAASSGSSSWRTCSGPRGPERRSTGSRHGVRAGFQGADLDPRTAGVGGVSRVHIDIGVLVHGIAIPMCAPADSACRWPRCGCTTAAGAAMPFRRVRPWRERPPLRDAWYGIGEGRHVHAHATLPGGRSRIRYPCRKAVQRRCGAADRQFASRPAGVSALAQRTGRGPAENARPWAAGNVEP